MGLFGWDYWYMFYLLTSECYTRKKNIGFRRTHKGIIKTKTSIVTFQYNKYMGDGELEGMQKLHYNEMVMETNQWYSKLFFYSFVVGIKMF